MPNEPIKPENIESDKISDNQTWNTCPDCGTNWKTEPPIPGMLHRIMLCKACIHKNNLKHFNRQK